MKIRIFYQSLKFGGGMERYAIDLIDGFTALQDHVTFYARQIDPELIRKKDINVRKVPGFSFPRELRDYYFYRKIDGLSTKLDGFHISLSRLKVKDIAVCGGTHLGYLKNTRRKKRIFDKLQIFLEKKFYENCKIIVAHSNLCAREIRRYYNINREKIITVYPPVNKDRFNLSMTDKREYLKRQFGFKDNEIVFLFPSTGHKRKGLRYLIDIFKEYKNDVTLAVAGRPVRKRIPRNVRYLGYVKNIEEAYTASDYTILGSLYEGFGLVSIESILCGTPVILEENIGSTEVIDDKYVMKFSVKNLDTLRERIDTAISLAKSAQHRIPKPEDALLYNPDVISHVKTLKEILINRCI